jgi:hypothetical protein
LRDSALHCDDADDDDDDDDDGDSLQMGLPFILFYCLNLSLVLVYFILNRASWCDVATSEDNASGSATQKYAGCTRWYSGAGGSPAEGDSANSSPPTAAANTSTARASLDTGYCK